MFVSKNRLKALLYKDMFRWFSKKEETVDVEEQSLKEEVKRLDALVTELKAKPDTILYYDGTLYVGGVTKDENGYNRPHGFGTICYASGSRYIGEWKDGLYNGTGTFYQDYYTPPFSAEWLNHLPHGKLTWDGIHFDMYENGIKK